MAEIWIKVGSITNAQRAKRELIENGFSAKISRSQKIKKGEGCGYSILTDCEKQNALRLLKKAGIRIISVR